MAKRKARTTLVHSSTPRSQSSGAQSSPADQLSGKTNRHSPAARNSVAGNPLLGKGSVHGKSKKANRRADKISLLKALAKRGGRDPEGYLQSDSILQIVFRVFACRYFASLMSVYADSDPAFHPAAC